MDFQNREIKAESAYPILADFLYEAIFAPEGHRKAAKVYYRTAKSCEHRLLILEKWMTGVWLRKGRKRLWVQYGCVL